MEALNKSNLSLDYFSATFYGEESASMAILALSWLLVYLLGTPLFLGIISFKMYGSLNYQTLIDKLNSYLFCLAVFYSLTGFNVVTLRVFTPVPRSLCILQILELHAIAVAACATACENFILRYLYSCVWKNIGALNDDFVGCFLAVANTFLSCLYSLVLGLTKDYDGGLPLSLCDGSNPEGIRNKKLLSWYIHPTIAVLLFMGIICFLMNFLICCNKRSFSDSNLDGHNSSVASMFGMTKLTEVFLTIANVLAVFPTIYVRFKFEQGSLSTVPPWLVTFSLVSSSVTFNLTLPLAIYLRNQAVRRHINNIVKEWPVVDGLREIASKWKA